MGRRPHGGGIQPDASRHHLGRDRPADGERLRSREPRADHLSADVPQHLHGHQPGSLLEDDRRSDGGAPTVGRAGDHEGGPDVGMPRKRDFVLPGEDPDAGGVAGSSGGSTNVDSE